MMLRKLLLAFIALFGCAALAADNFLRDDGTFVPITAGTVSNAMLTPGAANTVKGTLNGASETDLAVTNGCTALTWTNGAGFSCASISTAGTLVSFVTYSGTQTITIPATATRARIRLWGGSGGSGGVGAAVISNAAIGGGASGAYLEKYLTGLTAGNTLAYTQGAAGAAGANTGGNGGNGTSSTLASGTQTITTLTAPGGGGSVGTNTDLDSTAGGTAAAIATNGDTNLPGVPGGSGIGQPTVFAQFPGTGGVLFYSIGAIGKKINNSTAGGVGAVGGLIIEWFT